MPTHIYYIFHEISDNQFFHNLEMNGQIRFAVNGYDLNPLTEKNH